MKIAIGAMVAALMLAVMSAPAPGRAQAARVVQGAVEGVRQGKVDAFLGLPFAAPPVGQNRWREPQPASAWTGVRKADKFGASCEQQVVAAGFGPWTPEYVVQGAVSEDCLYLNVWAPADRAEAQRLPVLVWIHGGGFSQGSGSVPIYDGANLAARGLVVVNINYRLGVFGFLAHPELTREAGTSGNYGIQDMIAALKWVRDNAPAFGGDPANVTIAGQSAGAEAVQDLIAAPEAKGLFVRAIAQSSSGIGRGMGALADAERSGLQLSQRTNAATPAELRRLTVAQVSAAANGANPGSALRFGPIVDGKVLPRSTNDLPKGAFNDTPVLTGLTADEGSGLQPNYGKASVAEFSAQLDRTFGDKAVQARSFYPAANDAEAGESAKVLVRERGLAATYGWAVDRASKSSNPVYLYYFTHVEPGPESARYGAFHSSEIPYVFQTLDKSPARPFTAQDRGLSETMAAYWVNFARSGDPNGGALPKWPAFDPEAPRLLELKPQPEARPVLPGDRLEFYNSHVDGGGRVSLF